MSAGLVTGLLFAAISMNMRSVECSIKKAEAATSKSEKIMSVQGRELEQASAHSKGIFPGTKWCGVGNVAKNDSDFGTSENTDKCCKAFDECKPSIKPGDTYDGTTNTENYTLAECDCDTTFFQCIIGVIISDVAPAHDRKTAKELATLYYDGNRKCLQLGYKKVCTARDGRGNCIKYKDSNRSSWIIVAGK